MIQWILLSPQQFHTVTQNRSALESLSADLLLISQSEPVISEIDARSIRSAEVCPNDKQAGRLLLQFAAANSERQEAASKIVDYFSSGKAQ